MSNPGDFVIENGVLVEFRHYGLRWDIIVPEEVKVIGNHAFSDRVTMQSITLPRGLEEIGEYAFFGCESLISITLPEGLMKIGDFAFWGCSGLESVTLPDGLTEIGRGAFGGCTGLQSIVLPESRDILWLADRDIGCSLLDWVCRQADEAQMAELISRAGKSSRDWKKAFYEVYLQSDTHAAMLLAEKRKEFGRYAEMRGIDPDELRDRYLSDPDLDAQWGRTYDLGPMTVTARMQPDFSFRIELPDGKTAKSLPKKGSDPEKYEAAKKDLAQRKKDIEKIWKNRADTILGDFLTGRERTAEYWKRTYDSNPVLHAAACLVVWEQDGVFFTHTDTGVVGNDGRPLTLTDGSIRVAHPMEMKQSDVEAWQRYFSSRGLKQPFAQIWEPVYKKKELRSDRYAGCPIPFFQLRGAEKHGFNEKLEIPGCQVEAKWCSGQMTNGKKTSFCDIRRFSVKKNSRQVNHAVAYLDRITISGRIAKDDVTVMDLMSSFTLAQITEFIAIAQEANAVNVLALLLEYKKEHFAGFDPMEEFTLEW